MKRILILILLLITVITTPQIKANENTQLTRWSVFITDIMGSSVNVTAHTNESQNHEEYKLKLSRIFLLYNYLSYTKQDKLSFDEFEALEYGETLTPIKTNVEDLNNNVGTELEISKELYDMLTQAEEIRISSNGYFDYSIGHIIDVWKRAIRKYDKKEIPESEFNQIIDEVNNIDVINNPITLRTTGTKYFATVNNGAKLDMGAFAKGYATQQAVNFLKANEVDYYLINAGTSSIAVGKNPDYPTYLIGLREPVLERSIYGTVEIVDSTITTSGDYEQYFTYRGQRFHYIISPKTKTPVSNYHVLSIIGEDAGLMDAASTALFSMGLDDAKIYLNQINAETVFYEVGTTNIEISKITSFSEKVKTSRLVESAPKKGVGRYIVLGITIVVSATIIYFAVNYFIKTKKQIGEDSKLRLRRDLILFGVLVIVFGGIYLNYHFWPREAALCASITYRQETYVEVNFNSRNATILKYQEDKNYPKKELGEDYLEITLLGDYKVDGVNQEVVIFIDFDQKRIKVSEEKSPFNLCSKQGWTTYGYIICLPNSISIGFDTGTGTDGVV